MANNKNNNAEQYDTPEHIDTLIIGAGLSGIGLAYYMQRDCPQKSYAIIESRENSGGTWDLFRYPGIRSDSDLFTFGYEFKPWEDKKAIADGPSILSYIKETAAENHIDQHIRYNKRVIKAAWQSDKAQWLVTIKDGSAQDSSNKDSPNKDSPNKDHSAQATTDTLHQITCDWLFSAAGYYKYEEGFTPNFPNKDQFKGQIIHPQQWPEDLDYQDKKVVIIGSGATAVTLLPAMADKTAHITMLQRTPTYVMSLPEQDPIANALRKVLPAKTAYHLIRQKNIHMSRAVWYFCQAFPNVAKKLIRANNRSHLPKDYPVEEHFNPPYNPWDQRLCAVPNGDLFKALATEKASIVTDHIASFTRNGIQLRSGKTLEADIIITATGLNVQLFGGIEFERDGNPITLSESVVYKGMMLSDLPNFAFAIGYTNSSWTLKVGLLCEYFCRLQNHMDDHNFDICQPQLPSANMATRPLLDFGAGYVQRVIDQLPKQGLAPPWRMSMDYREDLKQLRKAPLLDQHLIFDHL